MKQQVLITTPGDRRALLAYTITLLLGYFLIEPGARTVFLPQTTSEDFVARYRDAITVASARVLANAW